MKQFNIEIPENLYQLSEKELNVINAISNYFACVPIEQTGMTKEAYKIVCELYEKLSTDEAIGSFQVWK
jgi:hypothetical protein